MSRVVASSSARDRDVPVPRPVEWASMSRSQLLAELRTVWALASAIAFERAYRVNFDNGRWFAFYKKTYREALDYDMSFATSENGDAVEVTLTPSPVARVTVGPLSAFTRSPQRRSWVPLVRRNRERYADIEGGWLVIFSEGWPGERRVWAPTLEIACETGRHARCEVSHYPPEVLVVLPPSAR